MRSGGRVPLPEPVAGSVYGFRFSFGDTGQKKNHPGIVIGFSMPLEEGNKRVIAVAVSHAFQQPTYDPRESIMIPPAERLRMGLDPSDQWVCLNEVAKFDMPSDARLIHTLNAVFLGQTSPAFLREVQEGVKELWKRRRKG